MTISYLRPKGRRWGRSPKLENNNPWDNNEGNFTGKIRTRNSEGTSSSEPSRTRGKVFSFGKSYSEHTRETDLTLSDEHEEKRRKRPRGGKRKKKGRLNKLFFRQPSAKELQRTTSGRFMDSFESTQNMSSFELSPMDMESVELSQEDVAEWVREQLSNRDLRPEAKNEKKYNPSTVSATKTNIKTNTSKVDGTGSASENNKSSGEGEHESKETKPPSLLFLPVKDSSSSSLLSSLPSVAEEETTTLMATKTVSTRPKELAQPSHTINRRKKSDRRKKTVIDITAHSSTSVEEAERPKTRKSKPRGDASSSRLINGRRKYPSKKHHRKRSRNTSALVSGESNSDSENDNNSNSNSNRIDFTGEISSLKVSSPKKTKRKSNSARASTSLRQEIYRLQSLVDLMMVRMELYEKQSECLVEASLAHNQQLKTATVESGKTGSSKKKQKPLRTATREEGLDLWITKLEKIQKSYQEQLASTKNQIKTLKDDQALTNKMIIACYQQRLERRTHTNKAALKKKQTTAKGEEKSNTNTIMNASRSNRSRSMRSEESSLCGSERIDTAPDIDDSCHTMDTLSERSVKFNPTVNVKVTLSRYDMCPQEKFSYWAGDGDEDMDEEFIEMLNEKWAVRKQVQDLAEELSSHSRGSDGFLGDIERLLPSEEREGEEGYTYTVGIQN